LQVMCNKCVRSVMYPLWNRHAVTLSEH